MKTATIANVVSPVKSGQHATLYAVLTNWDISYNSTPATLCCGGERILITIVSRFPNQTSASRVISIFCYAYPVRDAIQTRWFAKADRSSYVSTNISHTRTRESDRGARLTFSTRESLALCLVC